jgi:hypothetical protein
VKANKIKLGNRRKKIMEKVRKLVNWRLVAIVTLTLMVSIYFTMASATKLYINGNEVPSSQGEAFEKDGKMYVPLEAVVKGMGDKYDWNNPYRTASLQKSNGQKIHVTNGKSVAKIGYKFIPLSTKQVNKTTVSSGVKALMINNVIYVPIDFIQKGMGYPVTIKQDGGSTKVYVGTVPQEAPVASKPSNPTPTPTKPSNPTPTPPSNPTPTQPSNPTPTPTPTPPPAQSSTLDRDAVMNKLASNGFYKMNTYYATLNPYNPGGSGYTAVSLGLSDESNMVLEILAWTDPDMPEMNIIPGKVQFVLNQMIPSGAGHIYSIVSQTAVSGQHNELNKVFTYNGLKTKVTYDAGRPAVRVIFSK